MDCGMHIWISFKLCFALLTFMGFLLFLELWSIDVMHIWISWYSIFLAMMEEYLVVWLFWCYNVLEKFFMWKWNVLCLAFLFLIYLHVTCWIHLLYISIEEFWMLWVILLTGFMSIMLMDKEGSCTRNDWLGRSFQVLYSESHLGIRSSSRGSVVWARVLDKCCFGECAYVDVLLDLLTLCILVDKCWSWSLLFWLNDYLLKKYLYRRSMWTNIGALDVCLYRVKNISCRKYIQIFWFFVPVILGTIVVTLLCLVLLLNMWQQITFVHWVVLKRYLAQR